MTEDYRLADWKERYAELYAEIQKAQTPTEITKTIRRIHRLDDSDTLPFAYCEGALQAFKQERKEQLIGDVSISRSTEEARIDRIAFTRNSDGRRSARRWN